MAAKRLFMLTSLKRHPIQEGQGQLFGMRQSHANTWIPLLHPVLNQALADQDLLPARTAAECAAMFKTRTTDGRSTAPPVGMMVLHARSAARPIPKRNKHMTAARRSVTRATTSSCSTRPVTCASCVIPVKAQRLIKAWQSRQALPYHLAAPCIKIRGSRASSSQGSSSSTPRKTPLEGN
jgi:hypothetical protein